jgi:hypothetical protein
MSLPNILRWKSMVSSESRASDFALTSTFASKYSIFGSESRQGDVVVIETMVEPRVAKRLSHARVSDFWPTRGFTPDDRVQRFALSESIGMPDRNRRVVSNGGISMVKRRVEGEELQPRSLKETSHAAQALPSLRAHTHAHVKERGASERISSNVSVNYTRKRERGKRENQLKCECELHRLSNLHTKWQTRGVYMLQTDRVECRMLLADEVRRGCGFRVGRRLEPASRICSVRR